MSKAKELVLILSVVALVVLFLSRQGGKSPGPVEPTASATPQPTAASLASGTMNQEQREDFENAKGMAGFTEVSQLSVPPSTPEALARGKELYSVNCALCHGDNLAGDGSARGHLDPPPSDLRNSPKYKYGHLEPAIFRTTMYGIEGTGMAPWDGILTPDEVWDVTHYVRSMQILVETETESPSPSPAAPTGK